MCILKIYYGINVLIIMILVATTPIFAQNIGTQNIDGQNLIRLEQQQKAIAERLAPIANISNAFDGDTPPEALSLLNIPEEIPCFVINKINFKEQNLPEYFINKNKESQVYFKELKKAVEPALGKCLGGQGLNAVMQTAQNSLIKQGYITSRILAGNQNLSSGSLNLIVMAGRIDKIIKPENSHISLRNNIPIPKGEVLSIRDLEQAADNLQRVPTVTADIEVVPSDIAGMSDLKVNWQQSKMWRVGLNFDNSGSDSTGKYQGGLTLSLDNPLGLSDLFYLSLSHDLHKLMRPNKKYKDSSVNYDGNLDDPLLYKDKKNNYNYATNYSVPFGYWTWNINANKSGYLQTVAGSYENYEYSGTSNSLSTGIEGILYRSSKQKITLNASILKKRARSYLNDTEIEIQRRATSAWRLDFGHQYIFNTANLETHLSYQKGTRWFGSKAAFEEDNDDATTLTKIIRLSVTLNKSFAVFDRNFRFNSQYQGQLSRTHLTPQDLFSIGNRWSVRGFDGEQTLALKRGYFVQNTLYASIPEIRSELYFGADFGRVGGKGSEYLLGNSLSGGVIGIRSAPIKDMNLDFFVGKPFSKPTEFKTSKYTFGLNLNYQF